MTCRKGTAFLDWLTGELLQQSTWRRNMPLLAEATPHGSLVMPADAVEWSESLRRSLAAKLAEPDLFERFCKDTLADVQPVHSVSVLDDPLPIETLRFERPPGRRHYFANGTGAGSNSSVTITVAGSEIEAEQADAVLLGKILDAEAFTLSDIRAWQPDVAIADVTELLAELTRSGFLIATRSS